MLIESRFAHKRSSALHRKRFESEPLLNHEGHVTLEDHYFNLRDKTLSTEA